MYAIYIFNKFIFSHGGSPSHHGCFNTNSGSNDLDDFGVPPCQEAPIWRIIGILYIYIDNIYMMWDTLGS